MISSNTFVAVEFDNHYATHSGTERAIVQVREAMNIFSMVGTEFEDERKKSSELEADKVRLTNENANQAREIAQLKEDNVLKDSKLNKQVQELKQLKDQSIKTEARLNTKLKPPDLLLTLTGIVYVSSMWYTF